jgi:hypothetical protein
MIILSISDLTKFSESSFKFSVSVDVAGHQVVQHGVLQELQLLIADSQPVVSIAGVGDGLEEKTFP